MKTYSCLVFILLLVSCTTNSEKIIFHPSHEPKKSNAVFSDAVQVGNIYFLSGQVGMNHTTRTLVSGGVVEETKQAIKNIEAVLKEHGMDLQSVVKCTVILKNIEDFKSFNEVYASYFIQKPARTTFSAKALAVGALVEIECVAVKK